MINHKVGFIGGGNMARAIAGGLLRVGMHATNILIAEPRSEQCDLLRQELYGALISNNNSLIANQAETLLFAVKPQILKAVCRDLASIVQRQKPLIISIAAGSRINDIDNWLGGGMRIIRVMPNQPALIDQGISALFANKLTENIERDLAENIMSAVGRTVWLKNESLMDGVTAISGTGPAYFYFLIDIMIESAVNFGIDPETARFLAIETSRGATALASAETESMSSLIERVRSPGGTTIAAFEYLDTADVRNSFVKAIDAAKERSIELAQQVDKDEPIR
jgi:pyrroline-5-carboxylate reductase